MVKNKLIWKSKIVEITDMDKGIRIRLVDNVTFDIENIDTEEFLQIYKLYENVDYIKIPLN